MLIKYVNATIKDYKNNINKGLLVDSNLILVYLIGELNQNFIKDFSRTKTYTLADYKNVKKIIEDDFQKKLKTTPNILTEVNSLANKLTENDKEEFALLFSRLIEQMDEIYQESKEIVSTNTNVVRRFGLTDAVIVKIVKKYDLLLLTDDFKLSGYINKLGSVQSLNIRHVYSSH
jgi:sugar-specific transcriptional regulator TrmB